MKTTPGRTKTLLAALFGLACAAYILWICARVRLYGSLFGAFNLELPSYSRAALGIAAWPWLVAGLIGLGVAFSLISIARRTWSGWARAYAAFLVVGLSLCFGAALLESVDRQYRLAQSCLCRPSFSELVFGYRSARTKGS